MFPPSGGYSLSVDQISSLAGSISIACWIVVFTPQIVENFKRSSAEGLSVEFVVIWLLGDVFNILGAVLQGVLPTMIILAIYYTVADLLLLGQCFYYRGFTLRDPSPDKSPNIEDGAPSERAPLLQNGQGTTAHQFANAADIEPGVRNRSSSSFRERLSSLDGTHLSPAIPMHPQPKTSADGKALAPGQPRTWAQAILFNSIAIILVVLAGIAGFALGTSSSDSQHRDHFKDQANSLTFSVWGQIFGYICAILYLGSRVPQILLNYRRKSTEGLNALFFLFACLGNLTYVCSIFAFEPKCFRQHEGHWQGSVCGSDEAGAVYGRYILVNLSWLLGSLGTLFLDLAVFGQFWSYRSKTGHELVKNDSIPRDANGEGRGRGTGER